MARPRARCGHREKPGRVVVPSDRCAENQRRAPKKKATRRDRGPRQRAPGHHSSDRQELSMRLFAFRGLALALGAALGSAFAVVAPAAAETPLKMVLNWKYQGPQGFFFVAVDKGYFKQEGLDVT